MTLERSMDKLVNTIHSLVNSGTGENESPLERRWATVTAVYTTTPKTIDITLAGNSVTGIPCIKQYTPTVGDKVLLLQEGFDLIAIGSF